MIRIAVVDDNEMIRKQVKRFLNTYALKNSVVFEIYTYEDGHLLTLDINHEMHFDLIYLDIEMPIQNGIQVGHWIREIAQDEWMQIVFISGKDGYDRKLFSINCLDFLSKPICYSDLERTVNRFRKLTRRPEDVFTFQNNHVLQRVPIANILYFESTNRKVNIITTTDMADKTRYYKETPEGVSYMCKAIEEMRNKAVLEDKLESALKMIADGSIPLGKIAAFLGLNLEDLQELANSVASNT